MEDLAVVSHFAMVLDGPIGKPMGTVAVKRTGSGGTVAIGRWRWGGGDGNGGGEEDRQRRGQAAVGQWR